MAVKLAKSLVEHPLQRRGHWGLVTMAALLLLSYGIWIGSMAWYDDWYDDPWKYPAKVGSHGAVFLMCWSFILSTRFSFIEWLFGGLDKVYKAHRYAGQTAFYLIFLHPIFLAAHRLEESFGSYFSYFVEWRNPAIATGVIALFFFALLVVLSIYWKIAYSKWKQSHNFFGVLFLLIIGHALLGQGEIVKYPLLGAWYGLWCVAGVSAYLYIRVFYRWIGPQFNYRITEVREIGAGMTEVSLRPVGRRLAHSPGQFVYVSFDAQAVSGEPHPFSLASPPEADEIRFSIKELGDWTEHVDALKAGERARLWGPYGKLSEPLWQNENDAVVFIAGGVGVSPFLGIVGSEALRRRSGPVVVVYSAPNDEEAVYARELEEQVKRLAHGELLLHNSDEEGYIDRAWLESRLETLEGKRYFICGPGPMNESMETLLIESGVPPENVFVEDFQLR